MRILGRTMDRGFDLTFPKVPLTGSEKTLAQLIRAGDYVRLTPTRDPANYAVLGVASSLESLLQNQPLAVTASSPARNGGSIQEISLFAQDGVDPIFETTS